MANENGEPPAQWPSEDELRRLLAQAPDDDELRRLLEEAERELSGTTDSTRFGLIASSSVLNWIRGSIFANRM